MYLPWLFRRKVSLKYDYLRVDWLFFSFFLLRESERNFRGNALTVMRVVYGDEV